MGSEAAVKDRTRASPPGENGFGFDLPDDAWLRRVRGAEAPADLGRAGAYELLEEIGRGAQGVVYKARQPHTGRLVAVKRVGAGRFASEAARARFERELRLLASLHHPGVVTVFGADEIDGQRVLLMEWVDGRPIDAWAARRPVAEVLAVFAAACDAVHHAHRRGVIHRDLKPAHILVDGSGAPRVLDFGLAKLLEESESAGGRATRTGGFVGTPAYAAPEQLAGDPDAVDTRADAYALGAILYQLLTGVPPFDAGADLLALFEAIRRGGPRRPSALARGVGAELDAIVLRALAVEPDRRYPSVEALAADVRRHLAGQTVLAHPPSASYHLRKFVGRHRRAVALAAALAAAVLAFAVTAGVLAARLAAERGNLRRALAREQAALADAQRARADEAAEARKHASAAAFLRDMLVRVEELRRAGRVPDVRDLVLDAAKRLDAGALADQPAVEAEVRTTLAVTLRGLGLFEEMLAVTGRILDIETAAHGPESGPAAAALNLMSRALEVLGRLREAEAASRESIRVRALVYGAESPQVAGVMGNLASILHEQGRFAEAEACARDALRLGPNPDRAATARRNVGLELIEQGRWDEAEEFTRRAVQLMEAAPNVPVDALARARRNWGRILHARGRLDEAEAAMRGALDAWAAASGEDHPEIARDRVHLALIVADRGRTDEALAILDRSVRALEARLPPHHQWTTQARIAAGGVLASSAGPEAAEPVLRAALESAAQGQPGAEKHFADAAAALAWCLLAQGRVDEADACAAGALELLAQRPPPGEALPGECAALLARVREACQAARHSAEAPGPAP